jgi:hypothetical protein
MPGSIYVAGSKNSKLSKNGNFDCTYASIEATCPNSCALKEAGCYAKTSYVGIVNARLNNEAKYLKPIDVARAEAKAIDDSHKGGKVPSGRLLRLHVSGDSRTIKGSNLINSAVGRWRKRGDSSNIVWSYTHAWKTVPRKAWSHVSMLASIDSVKDAEKARERGYVPALVVSEHLSEKTYQLEGSDVKWIPCPAQTKESVTCENCKLCGKSEYLYETNRGIAFAAHGTGTKAIKRRLTVIHG